MYKKHIILYLSIVTIVLSLGIAYASIVTKGFTIDGITSAEVDTSQFDVKFIGTPSVNIGTTSATINASIDSLDDHKAHLDVSGLKTKGQTVTASYVIHNSSHDLSASLASPNITNSNPEYFQVFSTFDNNNLLLTKGNDITLTISVKLLKTPISSNSVASNTTITIVATPVQP